jgi:hypothetical protein
MTQNMQVERITSHALKAFIFHHLISVNVRPRKEQRGILYQLLKTWEIWEPINNLIDFIRTFRHYKFCTKVLDEEMLKHLKICIVSPQLSSILKPRSSSAGRFPPIKTCIL